MVEDSITTEERGQAALPDLRIWFACRVCVEARYYTFNDRARSLNGTDDWIAQILRNSNIRTAGPMGSSEAEYKTGLLYLRDLASASGGRLFSSEKLEAGTKSLLGELASKYYATITVPRKNTGSRPLRVRVNRPGVAVFARGSFVD